MLVSDETRCAMQQHSVADIDIEVVSLKNQMTKGDSSLRLGSFGLQSLRDSLEKGRRHDISGGNLRGKKRKVCREAEELLDRDVRRSLKKPRNFAYAVSVDRVCDVPFC